jgi:hypothetical protein
VRTHPPAGPASDLRARLAAQIATYANAAEHLKGAQRSTGKRVVYLRAVADLQAILDATDEPSDPSDPTEGGENRDLTSASKSPSPSVAPDPVETGDERTIESDRIKAGLCPRCGFTSHADLTCAEAEDNRAPAGDEVQVGGDVKGRPVAWSIPADLAGRNVGDWLDVVPLDRLLSWLPVYRAQAKAEALREQSRSLTLWADGRKSIYKEDAEDQFNAGLRAAADDALARARSAGGA